MSPGGSQDAPFNGNGVITSKPAGIDCTVTAGVASGTCSFRFYWPADSGLDVTLIATPSTGSLACRKYCAADQLQAAPVPVDLTLSSQDTETVDRFAFKLVPEALAVSTKGDGSGTVTSVPAGIACGSTCTQNFDYGTAVKLTAAPDAGASFTAWTGACAGQGKTCTVNLNSALSTNAVFGLATTTTTTTSAKPTTTAATTTVATTTTTATAGATTTVAGSSGSPTKLDAQLVALKTARSKLGAREVKVEISTNRTTSVALKLTRGPKTLAAHTTRAVPAGDRVLTLIVPPSVGKGRATLRIAITAVAGGPTKLRAGVSIPSP
jgi:hypothetical protein